MEGTDEIDRWDPTPVYQQLAAILVRQIESGRLQPRQPLPSETTLRQAHGVSRGTVREAVRVLREEGWVKTIPQRGSYVLPPEERKQKG